MFVKRKKRALTQKLYQGAALVTILCLVIAFLVLPPLGCLPPRPAKEKPRWMQRLNQKSDKPVFLEAVEDVLAKDIRNQRALEYLANYIILKDVIQKEKDENLNKIFKKIEDTDPYHNSSDSAAIMANFETGLSLYDSKPGMPNEFVRDEIPTLVRCALEHEGVTAGKFNEIGFEIINGRGCPSYSEMRGLFCQALTWKDFDPPTLVYCEDSYYVMKLISSETGKTMFDRVEELYGPDTQISLERPLPLPLRDGELGHHFDAFTSVIQSRYEETISGPEPMKEIFASTSIVPCPLPDSLRPDTLRSEDVDLWDAYKAFTTIRGPLGKFTTTTPAGSTYVDLAVTHQIHKLVSDSGLNILHQDSVRKIYDVTGKDLSQDFSIFLEGEPFYNRNQSSSVAPLDCQISVGVWKAFDTTKVKKLSKYSTLYSNLFDTPTYEILIRTKDRNNYWPSSTLPKGEPVNLEIPLTDLYPVTDTSFYGEIALFIMKIEGEPKEGRVVIDTASLAVIEPNQVSMDTTVLFFNNYENFPVLPLVYLPVISPRSNCFFNVTLTAPKGKGTYGIYAEVQSREPKTGIVSISSRGFKLVEFK